jgi:hypothetical protein
MHRSKSAANRSSRRRWRAATAAHPARVPWPSSTSGRHRRRPQECPQTLTLNTVAPPGRLLEAPMPCAAGVIRVKGRSCFRDSGLAIKSPSCARTRGGFVIPYHDSGDGRGQGTPPSPGQGGSLGGLNVGDLGIVRTSDRTRSFGIANAL